MGPQSLEGSNIKYSRICSLLIVGILFTKLDMAKPPSYPTVGGNGAEQRVGSTGI